MTRTFKFKGNPEGYRWDFPLVPGRTYRGDLIAYPCHTVQDAIEIGEKQKDKEFLNEWEETTPQ